MSVLRAILGWIGRHAILFAALVLALLAYQAWHGQRASGQAREQAALHADRAQDFAQLAAQLDAARAEAMADLERAEAEARAMTDAELRRSLEAAIAERDRLVAQRPAPLARRTALLTLDRAALLEDRLREIRIGLRERQIAGLQQAIAARNTGIGLETAQAFARQMRDESRRAFAAADRRCTAAGDELDRFNRQWNWVKNTREWLFSKRSRLEAVRDARCEEADRLRGLLDAGEERLRRAEAGLRSARESAHAWIYEDLPDQAQDLAESADQEARQAEELARQAARSWWQEWGMDALLRQAALLLLLIVLTPFAIRALFYFVLAPATERRPFIRLAMPGGPGKLPVPGLRSAPSLSVRLAREEEIFVRQDYLQTSPLDGAKSTRWLLDWRHPLASLASGLYFLVRLAGTDGAVTISALRDPIAEVALLELPEGAACTLKPRVLAAVVQPLGQPLRVTSHWRLFTLNAWLTLQLRYLVFHGPCRLAVHGGRGIRIEAAENGRIFGQDQLVGFSADLAYSVTRTETFWPYFLGREPLLKDKVEAGTGLLLIEEAPYAGRRKRGVRQGLEGMFDAVLKIFGL